MSLAVCAIKTSRDIAEQRLKTLGNETIGAAYQHGENIAADDKTDYVAKAISDLDWIYNGSRQVTYLNIDGIEYAATGGLSWGDDPTDAYTPLSVISVLAVCDSDEEWQQTYGQVAQ